MAEFLLEVGTEEIPARMLRKAEQDLSSALEQLFTEHRLAFTPIEAYGAPRQLVVLCRDVQARQDDIVETVTGPPVRIAYDADGKPTKALEGFLRNNPGLSAADLIRIDGPKGEVVAASVDMPGRDTAAILAEHLPLILDRLHFAKNMRWGSCPTRFVRPVRSLLAVCGGAVIPFEFGGMHSGNTSFGHRVCGKPRFEVATIDGFLAEKANQGIVVRHADRRAQLEARLAERLAEIGGQLVPDEHLLDEIADLVELPYIVLGSFDAKFLDIPKEVLITSLRDHQKSFCVQGADGRLMPFFLAVASIAGDPQGLVRKGNEWVLNARLYDARFFWSSDLRKDFDSLREKLRNQTFQSKIGNYYEKTERIARLCALWSIGLGEIDRAGLDFAARHCKTDLVSELVFEFPELQGITGGLLLERQGKSAEVAEAVYDSYLPVSMEDRLPRSKMGALVALADKLDTLVGCFAAGLIPTGTKDPYALRRAAQGIVRLLIEHELPFALSDLLASALDQYREVLTLADGLANQLDEFFQDRIRYYFKRDNVDHQLVNAVLASDHDRVDQTRRRMLAISAQMEREGFRNLALNLKRMNNVIADELAQLPAFEAELLREPAELELWQAYAAIADDVYQAVAERAYNHAMDLMVGLAKPVETYFGTSEIKGVFVNCDDTSLRHNRKAMLREIGRTLALVGDLSQLG